jgi:mRNA interferase MazF
MSRADIVSVVLPGAYGKPRPAVLVQDDSFAALPSVTVLPITSELRDLPPLRITIPPGPESGLRIRSQIQIDKVITIPKSRIGERIGTVNDPTMEHVNVALKRFLGLD